jgi:hypothetical protein
LAPVDVGKLIWSDSDQLAAAKRYARKIKNLCDSSRANADIDTLDLPQFPMYLLDITPSETLDKYTKFQFRNHLRWRFKLHSKEEADYLIHRIPILTNCQCLKLLPVSVCSEAQIIVNLKGIRKHVYESTPVGIPQLK